MTTDVEYDVFLTHSKYDDELVEEVKQLLAHNAVQTFATPGSIIRGKWEPQIERALQRSASIWVLLTNAALEESVWTHHELGYFYGFRHGQGQDAEGEQCRFLFTRGTPLPGLYGHFQGTEVDSFEDPAVLAETIAKAMQRPFHLPPDYTKRLIPSSRPETSTYPQLFVSQRGSSGHLETKSQSVRINIQTSQPLFNLDVGALSNLVSVSLPRPVPQIAYKEEFDIEVSWVGNKRSSTPYSLPADVQDGRNRVFRVEKRPNDPGLGDVLVISFDTETGASLGTVTYFTVNPHQKAFPEFQLVTSGAPFGWLQKLQPI